MIPKYATDAKYLSRGLKTFSLRQQLFNEINKKLRKKQKIKLLEIGCGKGTLLIELLNKYPRQLEVHGINLDTTHGITQRSDFRKNALENNIACPEKKSLPHIHFANATKMPFNDNEFDIVISQVTFLHIENKAKAIEETYRVLKTDGLALISIGPYSLRRKTKHAMPKFYKLLNKQLRKDYNPRFLITSGKKNLPLSLFIRQIKKKYNIRLRQHSFVSETQKARGFWLIIRREKADNLNLNLQYNKKMSKELTLKYATKNPVNFGCIDSYELFK